MQLASKCCSLHVNNNNALLQYIIRGRYFCIIIITGKLLCGRYDHQTLPKYILTPSLLCLQLNCMFVNSTHPQLINPQAHHKHPSRYISETSENLGFDSSRCTHVIKCLQTIYFTCKQQQTSQFIIMEGTSAHNRI